MWSFVSVSRALTFSCPGTSLLCQTVFSWRNVCQTVFAFWFGLALFFNSMNLDAKVVVATLGQDSASLVVASLFDSHPLALAHPVWSLRPGTTYLHVVPEAVTDLDLYVALTQYNFKLFSTTRPSCRTPNLRDRSLSDLIKAIERDHYFMSRSPDQSQPMESIKKYDMSTGGHAA